MDTLPNEIIRMLFENLTYRQKKGISRVCIIWRYLIASFHNQTPSSYKFVKYIGSYGNTS